MPRKKNGSDQTTESPDQPLLDGQHYRMLSVESGISDHVIQERGYRTIRLMPELRELGFSAEQSRVPGLLLPVHCTDGSNGLYVYRPDEPRVIYDKSKPRDQATGQYKYKVVKYEMPRGAGVRLDCPISCRSKLADPRVRLFITEGQKKGDALASREACAVALLGVWNWKGRNSLNGITFLADWQFVTLPGREVVLVFDSDVMTKPQVKQALDLLVEILQRKGAHCSVVHLPMNGGDKVGVDDFLLDHSLEDLFGLIEGPRYKPSAAAPKIELLLDEPAIMRRPISHFAGSTYAAVWPLIKVIRTESHDRDGNVIKLEHPEETTERYPLVIRDDGRMFRCREDDNLPVELAPEMEFKLDTLPDEKHLWSTKAFQQFTRGVRPDPLNVFTRITEIVDHHIDFDRSLAEQQTMCEMIACYVLSTWFLDAFQVIGYLWPNGEFGSGKSELLKTITQMAFMGEMIMAQSTIATIRDAADYGATLAFDEVERLQADKTKSDLLAILLAGNTRGATLAAKEPGKQGIWVTRRFNCFCPRLFAAKQLPDGALSSRTIIVPLVRSTDRDKSTRMVMDVTSWPHSRADLIDDLWATAVTHLKSVKVADSQVASRTELRGRQLEPWRAILAVAIWMDDVLPGVFNRLETLARSYQKEAQELDRESFTKLVIQALDAYLICTPDLFACDVSDVSDVVSRMAVRIVKTSELNELCKTINRQDEYGIEEDKITERRTGFVLRRLRFTKHREGGTGKRGWEVPLASVNKLKLAFGLHTPETTSQTVTTSHEPEMEDVEL